MPDPTELPDASLRVSAAQRDHAATLLREAVVDERLTFEEMEARIPAALILRGVTSSTVQVRHPNGRDRRLLRKFAERQQAQRRELTQG
ncbi:DUF1707 domain-containing protein [Parenemella sanctibonifatiensis]|uniref:DUF1707 domain-containing protein n=1 Tax=Parenemella sanctibonifatiensis TaxID=2016505 RepID=A0A255E8J7_9ACTN|nr:DUF1707 domain-containing protein [Parenemella sanctibonifatiensis]OYN87879.1 hypothetical protein CGZ92_06360 [Parenemella sanctibonifatiensis]